jgi:hypothetical protein
MPKNRREIPVFIASPGDLAPERQVVRQTIDELNRGYGDGAGVQFQALGWEDSPASTGRRVQSVINADVDRAAVFILALHRRWGQPAPDSKYSSYTEEEFFRALDRFEKSRAPEIWVFLKNVDPAFVADPGPELTKVLEFRKKLEARRDTLIKTFATETEFAQQVDEHLRDFVEGRWAELDKNAAVASDPSMQSAITAAAEANKPPELSPDLSLVKADKEILALTRAGVLAANAGLTQDASVLFAKATQGTTNLSILAIATEFYRGVGDLETVSNLVRRQGAIARDRTLAAKQYMSLMPAGFIKANFDQTVNQLLANAPPEEAEEMRSIAEEAFGQGQLEQHLFNVLVKHYSDAELAAFSRFLSAPEGQSALQKQPAMVQELMELGANEMVRVMRERGMLPPVELEAHVQEQLPDAASNSGGSERQG